MASAGVPTREDCASCPDTGDRCALHQGMLARQQELVAMTQTQQAHNQEPGEHSDSQANEQSQTAKIAAREMNRLKTQEGQMISALRKMNFDESRRQHDLTHKQKKRLRQRKNAALQTLDPAKVARREAKATQRAQDPERIARLEAHNQKTAENKARVQAKRARNIKESRQHGAGRLLMRKIKIETSDALEHASSAVQSHGADNDYVPVSPAIRTRGQRAAQEVNTKLQALATVHSMPEETGTDAFLDRADSLIHQTLASNSALSPTDRKNLEEALSLVRTVQLLSSKDYRPWQNSARDDGQFDRVLRGSDPEYDTFRPEVTSEDVYVKQEHTSEGDYVAQEHGVEFYGHLRGGASPVSDLSQFDVTGRDAMVE
ncbi:hypothetical protein E4T50_02237 [Aureobasidium sp. EXF-12298]|nr:hypothetical protein E4T50_02237 [Aureobasidium sp. EXF-12298]